MNIRIFLTIIILSFIVSSCKSQSQDDSIIGTYEYIVVNPKKDNIQIGELVLDEEVKISPERQRRIDSIDNLIKNDPRYSKRYLKFTDKHCIDYRVGDGWKSNYKRKGQFIHIKGAPFYKIKSMNSDTILIFDRIFKQDAFLIKTKDDLSQLNVFDWPRYRANLSRGISII